MSAAQTFATRTFQNGEHTLALILTSGRVRVTHTSSTVQNTAPLGDVPVPAPAPFLRRRPQILLRLVNDTRRSGYDCRSRGVFAPTSGVALEPRPTHAAQGHADDMKTNGYFSCTAQDGSTVGIRTIREGYTWLRVGDIVYGYPDADAVMSSWLGSDGHCANLPGYTELGVGTNVLGTGVCTAAVVVRLRAGCCKSQT